MSDIEAMSWEDAVNWLKLQPGRSDLVRACFYDDPLLDAANRYHGSSEWFAIRKLLKGYRGAALDIGAGRGISSYALAKDGWSVTALEPDPSISVGSGAIHSLAEEAGLAITVTQEWGEKLPFEANQFDLVYCRAVLHHARDLNELCAEASRVLRKGGLFVATREHVLSKSSDLDSFLQSHPLHALYGGEHAYLLSDYIEAIQLAGLKISKVFNPYSSDINLFPGSIGDLKNSWARRLGFPFPSLIPDFVLKYMGNLSKSPGRLYSFVAVK